MRTLSDYVFDTLRLVRVLPPLVDKDEEDSVDIKELADADREGQERLKRARKNLGPLRRGEISEETFYKKALGVDGEDGDGKD